MQDTLRLNDSIDPLFAYSQIIVTGPQRSGTTFTARAIASTLSMSYMDEDKILVRNKERLIQALTYQSSFVVQAPGCTHFLHEIDVADTAIVWVRRPLNEILASQERVKWSGESTELREYKRFEFSGCPKHIRRSAEVKTWHWDSWQKSICKVPAFEMDYHCEFLKSHGMWIKGEDRKGFRIRQWSR